MRKKTIEQEINEFLEKWDVTQMDNFLRDIIPLFELWDIQDENNWVRDAVGESDERTVRLIRTVYLVSRIAEFHGGMLAHIKVNFKHLYKRMENNDIVEVKEG